MSGSHLQIERGHDDVVAGLPQQVLVMWHHHVTVVRQVTVQLQHLRAVLHSAADRATTGDNESLMSSNVS